MLPSASIAFWFTLLACSWMVGEYFLYARRTYKAVTFSSFNHDRVHKRRLATLFVSCGLIHMVHVIVPGVCGSYLLGILLLANAMQAHLLNRSKVQLLADQEFDAGQMAARKLIRIKEVLRARMPAEEQLIMVKLELQHLKEDIQRPGISSAEQLRIAVTGLEAFIDGGKK